MRGWCARGGAVAPDIPSRIGVVILNHNGWQNTVACAESVLASAAPPAWLIIVDNDSSDGSRRWLRHWAAGHMEFALPELGAPAAQAKPLPLLELDEAQAETAPPAPLVLLRRGCNGGYAAGMNAGIRPLLRWGAEAVWLLNNDTVVERQTLGAMARRLFGKHRPGLCGSLVRYRQNGLVQCCAGGRTNRWTGLSVLEGNGERAQEVALLAPEAVESRLDFIYGASVMVSRAFLETVGLLDERYFLYYEEQDWAYSARGRFDFAYAPDAVIWHKEGATTGFSRTSFNPRRLFDLTRSRLLLTAKHAPAALPTVCVSIAYAAVRMLWRRFCKRPTGDGKAGGEHSGAGMP